MQWITNSEVVIDPFDRLVSGQDNDNPLQRYWLHALAGQCSSNSWATEPGRTAQIIRGPTSSEEFSSEFVAVNLDFYSLRSRRGAFIVHLLQSTRPGHLLEVARFYRPERCSK